MPNSDSGRQPTTFESPADTARYIGSMAVELRGLAGDAGLDFLAHILDMAIEEAESHAGQVRGARTARAG